MIESMKINKVNTAFSHLDLLSIIAYGCIKECLFFFDPVRLLRSAWKQRCARERLTGAADACLLNSGQHVKQHVSTEICDDTLTLFFMLRFKLTYDAQNHH